MQSFCPKLTPKVTSGVTIPDEWHILTRDHTVLPATHMFIHEWNEPTCIQFVSIPCKHSSDGTEQGITHIYRSRKDEWLSLHSWLTLCVIPYGM